MRESFCRKASRQLHLFLTSQSEKPHLGQRVGPPNDLYSDRRKTVRRSALIDPQRAADLFEQLRFVDDIRMRPLQGHSFLIAGGRGKFGHSWGAERVP
jgi:hypothetical protein